MVMQALHPVSGPLRDLSLPLRFGLNHDISAQIKALLDWAWLPGSSWHRGCILFLLLSSREHHDDPSIEGEGHELVDGCSALCPRPGGIDPDPPTSFGRAGDHRPSSPRAAKRDLGTMWCKIEENAKTCPCGRMAERWALLSKGKRIATVTFCRLCHPQVAQMLNRPLPIAP